MADSSTIKQHVRNWLEKIVIDLNLCPFAKKELLKQRIRFVVTETDDQTQLLNDLLNELSFLQHHPETETTLLIHPHVLLDFYNYNDFLDSAEALLAEHHYIGIFQIASFHPNYQFANTQIDDSENYTNRSPYPLLHILRENSLEKAINAYGDTDDIPQRNIALMNEMGTQKIQALLKACLK